MFKFFIRLLDSMFMPAEVTPAPTVPPAMEPKIAEEKLRAMYQLGVIAERKRLIDLGILQPDVTMPSLQVIESNLKPAPLAQNTGPRPQQTRSRAGGLMRARKAKKRFEQKYGVRILPPRPQQNTEPIDTKQIFSSAPTRVEIQAILEQGA